MFGVPPARISLPGYPIGEQNEQGKLFARYVHSGTEFAVVNYEQAVRPFVETKRLSETERAMLMGGACAKAYGWSPSKG